MAADILSLLSKEVPGVNLDLRERITFYFRQLRCKGIDRMGKRLPESFRKLD